MLDKNKFKYHAADCGMQLNTLARKMGINPANFRRTICGTTEFTRKEIQEYQKITGVSDKDMLSIFFGR